MDDVQIGLFDLPEREPAPSAEVPLRGRNRETWVRTTTAEVTIVDGQALRDAAARARDEAVVVELGEVEDVQGEDPGEGAPLAGLGALTWLLWPLDGLERLLDAHAVRVVSMDSDVAAVSVDRARVTCSIGIKLKDVGELRRIAVESHPEEEDAINDSLEVAWRSAADPFAPLCSVPGIRWTPGTVEVEHLPARPNRKRLPSDACTGSSPPASPRSTRTT